MRNHDEKTRTMQRSVLPSTARKQARKERRLIHKRQRARERDLLIGVGRAAGFGAQSDFDPDPDFREGRRLSDTHWMVIDRRGADKIGPLTRWAAATVDADPDLRDAPLHERVAYFAALLPDDLIGKHAVQHIEWALKCRGGGSWRDRHAGAAERREVRRNQVAVDSRRILASGRHRVLNAALRRHYGATGHEGAVMAFGRLLLGAHDVEAFAADITGCGCLTEAACNRWRKCGRPWEVVAGVARHVS